MRFNPARISFPSVRLEWVASHACAFLNRLYVAPELLVAWRVCRGPCPPRLVFCLALAGSGRRFAASAVSTVCLCFASVCFWFALGLCVVLGVVPAVQQVDKRTQTATSQPIVILSAKTCKNPATSFWRGVCRLKNAKS